MKQLATSASVLLLSLFLFVLGIPDGYAQVQPTVSSVTLHQEGDGRERVRIKLEGTHSPQVYALDDDKPRLICDFPGAGYAGLVKPVVRGGGTLVQRIRVGAHDPPARKVRVVLDIEPGRKYTYTREFSKEENILNILLVPVGQEKPVAKAGQTGKTAKAVTVIEATAAKQVVITGPKKIYRTGGAQQQAPAEAQEPAAQAEAAEEKAPAAPTADAPAAAAVATTAPQAPEAEEIPTMSLGEPPASPPLPAKEDQPAAVSAEPAAQPDVPPAEEKAAPAVSTEAPAISPERAAVADAAVEKGDAADPAPPEKGGQTAETAAEPKPETGAADTPEPEPVASEQKEAAPAPDADGGQSAADEKTASAEPAAPSEPAAPEEKKAETAKPQLVEVSYENSSSKGEMIFFRLSGFHPPEVTAEESETPQVHCDFADMELGGEVEREIEARGAYVQKIVTTAEKGKVRASIELTVGKDYDLRQVFFKEDNLFVLIVNTLDEESADGSGPEAEAGDPAVGK